MGVAKKDGTILRRLAGRIAEIAAEPVNKARERELARCNMLTPGKLLTVMRKGAALPIVPANPHGKLDRLPRRPCIKCDPQSIVHLDWFKEWKQDYRNRNCTTGLTCRQNKTGIYCGAWRSKWLK